MCDSSTYDIVSITGARRKRAVYDLKCRTPAGQHESTTEARVSSQVVGGAGGRSMAGADYIIDIQIHREHTICSHASI